MTRVQHRFVRFIVAGLVAAACALGPSHLVAGARVPVWREAMVVSSRVVDPITTTTLLTAAATVTQGQTNVVLPVQVASGRPLVVTVQTRPRARVSLTVVYPDGTMRHLVHVATASGMTTFRSFVAYQPQGAAETAAVTIAVYYDRRRLGSPNDVVTRNVTVLQRIVLRGSLNVPSFVVVGTTLPIIVSTNLPNVAVRLSLRYPDGLIQPGGFASTGADGSASFSLPVLSDDGRHGVLHVQAILRYGGVERILRQIVHLRPAGRG